MIFVEVYWEEGTSPIHGKDLSPEAVENIKELSQDRNKKKSIQ